jgi:hypothetical protein
MRFTFHAGTMAVAFALLPACATQPVADSAPWVASFACSAGRASTSMALHPSGKVVLGGAYLGQLTIGPVAFPTLTTDDEDLFAASLDPGGTVGWVAAAASPGQQNANAVAFDPSGAVLLTGQFSDTLDFGLGPLVATSTDTFVAKLDGGGSPVWAKGFSSDDGGPAGGGDSNPAAVAVDASGNVAIGGTFSGTIGFGGAPLFAQGSIVPTSFVAKLDKDGAHVFSLDFGGSLSGVTALAFGPAGDLYVGGINSDTIVAGSTVLTNASTLGSTSAFVVKLDPMGVPEWALQVDGDGSTTASLAVDGSGNVLLGGTFYGHAQVGSLSADAGAVGDGLLVAISPAGAPLWIADLASATLTAVAAPAGGGAVVTGTYTGAPDFGTGVLPETPAPVLFVTRYDKNGTPQRTQPLQAASDPSSSAPSNIAQGTHLGAIGGDVVIAGTYSGVLDLNGTTLSTRGPGDLFAARFAF